LIEAKYVIGFVVGRMSGIAQLGFSICYSGTLFKRDEFYLTLRLLRAAGTGSRFLMSTTESHWQQLMTC
jgi:hypothetical protein